MLEECEIECTKAEDQTPKEHVTGQGDKPFTARDGTKFVTKLGMIQGEEDGVGCKEADVLSNTLTRGCIADILLR